MGDALAASYRAFDGRLPFGARPAVLLIDMVRAYLDPACPLHIGQAAEDAITAAATLARAARTAGAPVIFTNVSFRPDGRDGGLFYRKVPVLSAFHEGAATGAFDPRLQPEATDLVITKHYASAFFGTSLASTLNALGVDTAVIGGFSTSGCVRATALDTLQHGFVPYVVRDACADRHPGPHEANLFDLQAKYAEVVGLEDALARLAGA
ncbi:isochorismatase family protein [Sphingomonas azotifigens]|uniref:isochorismatase family protein n=1 Tax=Sphingomonas azotifigens TaxID=330920 RepID=UPI000A0287C5|nr:isochorismatase family protein [Sphingomonas azotifigens]